MDQVKIWRRLDYWITNAQAVPIRIKRVNTVYTVEGL
jgi:hypothetical protein